MIWAQCDISVMQLEDVAQGSATYGLRTQPATAKCLAHE